MFIIFGTRTIKTRLKEGPGIRRRCDRCHFLSEMKEYRYREYFTLFFIPIFPVSRGETLLVCARCGANYYSRAEDYLKSEEETGYGEPYNREEASFQEDGMVIECDYCKGRLRVPVKLGRKLVITCPHCNEKFDFRIDRNV